MDPSENPEAAIWNGDPGQTWVRRAGDLDTLLAGVLDLLIAHSAPRPGERILDIGCGSGASSRAVAAAVGLSGRVLGLDISEPLLALARAQGRANLAFALEDAEIHPLAGQAFDACVSRFGMMFFADPTAALRNIATGLRPAGRLVFAAWAGPAQNPFFAQPIQAAEARLGPAGPQAPDAPGPMAFRDIDRVVGLLRAAGLADCSGDAHRIDLHHPGGRAALVALQGEIGPIPRLMREKGGSAADAAAIAEDLARRLAPFATPDGIRVPAEINLFTARKP